jgi:hypothetical protein
MIALLGGWYRYRSRKFLETGSKLIATPAGPPVSTSSPSDELTEISNASVFGDIRIMY